MIEVKTLSARLTSPRRCAQVAVLVKVMTGQGSTAQPNSDIPHPRNNTHRHDHTTRLHHVCSLAARPEHPGWDNPENLVSNSPRHGECKITVLVTGKITKNWSFVRATLMGGNFPHRYCLRLVLAATLDISLELFCAHVTRVNTPVTWQIQSEKGSLNRTRIAHTPSRFQAQLPPQPLRTATPTATQTATPLALHTDRNSNSHPH